MVTDQEDPAPPCGLCLQALAEFVSEHSSIYLANLKEIKKEYRFRDLFPQPMRAFESKPPSSS